MNEVGYGPLPVDEANPEAPPGAIACLKEAGHRSVWRVRRDDQERTIKTWPVTAGLVLRLLVGHAQPQRHRRWQRRLTAVGIASPQVHAMRFVRRGRWLIELELDFVTGSSAQQRLAAGEASTTDATRVGQIAARLADAGMLNRDLKLSNLVIRDDGQIWLIDPVGLRWSRQRTAALERMLERLAIEPQSSGVHVAPSLIRATLRAACGRDRALRRAVRRLRRARRPR